MALVGNYERLAELTEEAANSQDAATLQTLKTMDAIDTKINQFQTTLQEFYTSSGAEELIKGVIDFGTELINKLNGLPKLFGTLPLSALGMIYSIISSIKNGATLLIAHFKVILDQMTEFARKKGQEAGEAHREAFKNEMDKTEGSGNKTEETIKNVGKVRTIGASLSVVGSLLNTVSLGLGNLETQSGRTWSVIGQGIGTLTDVVGKILTKNFVGAAISAVSGIINAWDTWVEDTEEKIERLKNNLTEASNKTILAKNELKTLEDYREKLEELTKTRYSSDEAYQEWLDLNNEIVNKYPELLGYMTSEGDKIANLGEEWQKINQLKTEYYKSAKEEAIASISYYGDNDALLSNIGLKNPYSTTIGRDPAHNIFSGAVTNGIQNSQDFVDYAQQRVNNKAFNLENLISQTFIDEDNLLSSLINYDFDTQDVVFNLFSSVLESIEEGKTLDQINQEIANYDFGKSSAVQTIFKTYEDLGITPSLSLAETIYEQYKLLFVSWKKVEKEKEEKIKEGISVYLTELDDLSESIDFSSQIQMDFMGSKLFKEYQAWRESTDTSESDIKTAYKIDTVEEGDYFKYWIEKISNYTNEVIAAFNGISDGTEGLNIIPLIQNLTKEKQEELDKLYLSATEYSLTEWLNAIEDIFETEDFDLSSPEFNGAEKKFKQEYKNQTGEIYTQNQKWFNELGASFDASLLSSNALQQLKSLEEDGFSSDLIISFGEAIYKLDKEKQDALINLLNTSDLTTISGYYDFIGNLSKQDIILDDALLEEIKNRINPNWAIETELALENLSAAYISLQDSFTKATEGLNLDEAIKFANTYEGISFADFKYDEEEKKWILTGKTLEEVGNSMIESTLENVDNTIQEIEKRIEELPENSSERQELETELEALEKAREYIPEMIATESNAIEKEIIENLDFTDISKVREKLTKLSIPEEKINELIQTLIDGTEYEIQYALENLYREYGIEIDFSELSSVADSLYNANIDLLTSILEGDKEAIYDIEDEDFKNDLINYEIIDETGRLTDNYIEGINTFLKVIQETGETIGEENRYNELRALALENLHKSKNNLNNLKNNLVGLSESDIADYLNNIDESIELTWEDFIRDEKTGEYFFNQNSFNKLGKLSQEQQIAYWKSLLENISETDYESYLKATTALGVPPQFQYLIKDAQNELFESIISSVTSAIGGGASYEEANQLIKEFDLNLSSDFVETADGLKITQIAALQVYDTLKITKPLAAQVVLDNLTESAMDSDESLNNIYKVMDRIKDLNKEIATAGVGSERQKVLQDELKLAENIRDTLMEAGDAFNFMEQDLPTGMTNPLSAWEGMGQAFEVLDGDDFKAGRIDFTDFYNMINQLDSAGVDLSTVAEGFNSDTQTASDLIRAAASALSVVDGKTFVDLSKLGETFKISADGMKEGLTDGIQVLAESQIDMLDAEIALLETVVNSQAAFSKIIGDDGIIDLSELNFFGEIKSNRTKEQQEVINFLSSYFGELEITAGITIAQLVNDPDIWSEVDESGKQVLMSLITKLNTFFQNEEWSTNGITGENAALFEQQLNAYFQELGLSFSINLSKMMDNIPINIESNQVLADKIAQEFNGLVSAEQIKAAIEGQDIKSLTYADLIDLLIAEGDYTGSKTELAAALTSTINEAIDTVNSEDALKDVTVSTDIKDSDTETTVLKTNGEWSETTPEGIKTLSDAAAKGEAIDVSFTVTVQTQEAATALVNAIESIKADKENLGISEIVLDTYETLFTKVQKIATLIAGLTNQDISISANITNTGDGSQVIDQTVNTTYTINAEQAVAALGETQVALDSLSSDVVVGTITGIEKVFETSLFDIYDNTTDAAANLSRLAEAIQSLPDKSIEVGNTASAMDRLSSKNITATVTVQIKSPTAATISPTAVSLTSQAKGNVALAKGTLMGELGPELYATGGHYYVAGQNGAEFVDLPDDAIVFNHLQTRKLLGNGSINGTGTPVTNEKKAVALATGTTGPAKASAQDALAELYAIRAMWQELLGKSAKDLGKKAGSGSGGSGSGGGSEEEQKAYIHDLERWYNLLRQIEKLEQQITYEQAKRENMQSGYKYVDSLEKELILLKKQQAAHQKLSDLQRDYYEKRVEDLKKTDYDLIFTYDKDGLMQYVDGMNRGLDVLATLNQTDAYGKPLKNVTEQLKYLKDTVRFDTSKLDINADGTAAEDDEQRMQNFWDGVDAWMDELDSLYDSYNESTEAVEESIQAQNEILQEYIDNQLAVEEKLMQAIVDREQAEIDRLQEEKDALEETSQAYIDGLNDSLNREKEMYDKNETAQETSKLQRQLAILQRSGGSTAEIKSLQDQIDSRLQDEYFNKQQEQINAIEEASNNQLEKMQEQIDLMTETLEYQKENGLLWQEVSYMMQNWSPEQLVQFFEEYTKSFKEQSALGQEETSEEFRKESEIWDASKGREEREEAWSNYYKNLSDYSEEFKKEHAAGAKLAFEEAYNKDGLEAAKTAADEYYKKANAPQETAPEEEKPTEEETMPSEENKPTTDNSGSTGGRKTTSSTKKTSYRRGDSGEMVKKIQEVLNNSVPREYRLVADGIFGTYTENAVKIYQKRKGLAVDGIVGAQTLKKMGLTAYKTGGLVDFTGPAWVDGSKSKPEAFLSASDTAMLKSKIFSNSDGSLKALVAALEEITNNTSRYSAETNNESIVIQNATVSIQPGTISNDYDARRAGEMALEEMVKIARKTTNRIVSR